MSDFGVQLGLFEPSDLGERAHMPAPTVTHLVDSNDAFAELLRQIEAADRVAFDTETTGIDMTRCELVSISICVRAGEGWYLPVALSGVERWSMHAPQGLALRGMVP